MSREQLVEKVRRMIDEKMVPHMGVSHSAEQDERVLDELARDLVAVVDAAHAPTDDDREALARLIDPEAWRDSEPASDAFLGDPVAQKTYEGFFWQAVAERRAPSFAAADRVIAGFHRTVQGEAHAPTDDERTPKAYRDGYHAGKEVGLSATAAMGEIATLRQERDYWRKRYEALAVFEEAHAPTCAPMCEGPCSPACEGKASHDGHEFCDARLGCVQGEPSDVADRFIDVVESWFDDYNGSDPGTGGWYALEVNIDAARAARRAAAEELSVDNMGPAASCHLCVGSGGREGYDGEWIQCSCQRQGHRGEPSDAQCVEIANRAQAETGRSIWPSTVRAVLRAAAAVEGESR